MQYCEFPIFNPLLWNENIPKDVKKFTNCYSYALNRIEFNKKKKITTWSNKWKKIQ